jgi:hypothetical protein
MNKPITNSVQREKSGWDWRLRGRNQLGWNPRLFDILVEETKTFEGGGGWVRRKKETKEGKIK